MFPERTKARRRILYFGIMLYCGASLSSASRLFSSSNGRISSVASSGDSLTSEGRRHANRIVLHVAPPGVLAYSSIVDEDSSTVYLSMWLSRILRNTDASDLLSRKSFRVSTLAKTPGSPRSSARGKNSPRNLMTRDLLYILPETALSYSGEPHGPA